MSTSKKSVVDAKADSKGNITAVRLSGNKTFTPLETAIRMADNGSLSNAHAVHKSDGSSYLRSNPDGKLNNNLDSMAED
jgi:hypothetical protein